MYTRILRKHPIQKNFGLTTMKHPYLQALLTSMALVATTACSPQASDPQPTLPSPPEETTVDAESTPPADPGTLQTYDGPAYQYPLSAQYPDTMEVDGGCSGEGCGFFFTFVPQGNALDNAEVHVFLPAGATSAAELESRVTGPNGLVENAGWTVNDIEAGGSEEFPYDWVETVISFSGDQEKSGYILLGETSGQAVQVLLQYPAEMADAYWPNAQIVLESLEFEEELLPLTPSDV